MQTNVKIVPYQGRTAIAVDGRIIPGMSYHSGVFEINYLREMAEAGIRIFLFYTSCHPKPPVNGSGRGDGKVDFDFSAMDDKLKTLAGLAPDVWIIPRIGIGAPRWWTNQHSEENVLFADSDITARQKNEVDSKWVQPSMASEKWRQFTSGWLGQLVEHIENTPYADRVLGYMLSCGGTEEWVYWGAQEGRLADYSLPALIAFRSWLKAKYGGDARLREVWHDQSASIAHAVIPSEQARRRCTCLVRDPNMDQPAIDYDLFLSDMCAETLLTFCHMVKELTGGRRLTGAFSSYLLWQTGLTNPVVNNAHLALKKLLTSPDIDFITGITSYDNREPGGPGSFMLPTESLQAAGKLAFNEVDVRTHLITNVPRLDKYDTPPQELLNLWPLKDAAESVSVYRREFAHHVIHGAAWWNFDMSGGWYSCKELCQDFAVQGRIARQALEWDMSSVAQAAGIISGKSPAFQRFARMQDPMRYAEWTDLQCDRSTANLYRAGLPIDWWLSDDLGRRELQRYKVLYFYNAMYLSAEERRWVEQLKSDGRTLIFVGLPGLVADQGLSISQSIALTGMHLRLLDNRLPLTIDVADYDDPLLSGCEVATTLGTGAVVNPCIEVDDPACRVLGVWRKTGKPAMAVREFDTWRSVFIAAPLNNAAIFRAIAQSAGCHIWVETDKVIFANRSLLALHLMPCPDPVTVHLPRPMKVTELFSGECVTDLADSFVVQDTRRHTTFLYHLE